MIKFEVKIIFTRFKMQHKAKASDKKYKIDGQKTGIYECKLMKGGINVQDKL